MSAKHVELSLSLKDALKRRFASVVDGFDTNGLPTLLIGAGTAGSQSAFIRIKPVDSIGVNSVGLSQPAYGPHAIQLVLETSTIANTPLLTGANALPLWAELASRGVRIELYMSANTNAVDVADITTGNFKGAWDGAAVEFGFMAAI